MHKRRSVHITSEPQFPKDEEFEISDHAIESCAQILRAFTCSKQIDVFENMTRAQYRSVYTIKYQEANEASRVSYLSKLKVLSENPKHIPENNLSVQIEDPFKILGLENKSEIQILLEKHAPLMNYRGNYAYSCSCGSGKTLAGIYLMFLKQCKTLIISSRNAINDQWFVLLQELYPKLIIRTRDGIYANGSFLMDRKSKKINTIEPDIWIYSPQYLVKELDSYASENINGHPALNPSLIIYDEVHSLMSDWFIQSVIFPFQWVCKGIYSELPFMISLSATYPSESSPSGKKALSQIFRIFGTINKASSKITDIPVKFWDYRDHFAITNEYGNIITGESARGNFDFKYRCLSDIEALKYFIRKINSEQRITISEQYKGIVMTSTIDSSIFAALYIHKKWNCNVLCIREHNSASLYLKKDNDLEYIFDEHISIDTIDKNIGNWTKDYERNIASSAVIVGTISRLKEGFSVQNIVWGICTKFLYNTIPRVQILGRIRRSSDDPELNVHERLFYVNSCRVPSTIGIPRYKGMHKVLYDFNLENAIFEAENYIRI